MNAGGLHVVPQAVFLDLLAREMRRAERHHDHFVLVLVEGDGSPAAGAPWLAEVASAVNAFSDRTIAGWFAENRTFGIVVPNVDADGVSARLCSDLRRRLDRLCPNGFAVDAHLYAPASDGRPTPVAAPFLAVPRSPRSHGVERAKRALDVALVLALLVVALPLGLLIAVAIKLTSPGPVLFRQKRIGRMGRPFTMLKFRSMQVNADPLLHYTFIARFIRSNSPLHLAGSRPAMDLDDDPRVTPIGRILRRTCLDEVPQLWNVLRGEMSLVGPRPPLGYEVELYRPWHWRRVVDAKPGITGLWQVAGRRVTTFDEMVRLDLRYARASSLWTDTKILLATPAAVVAGRGIARRLQCPPGTRSGAVAWRRSEDACHTSTIR